MAATITDLNPIEQCWAKLESDRRNWPTLPTSVNDLITILKQEWEKLG